jgi:hypothetical protein
MVSYGIWYGMVWCGMGDRILHVMVMYGKDWYGMAWCRIVGLYGMVGNGRERYGKLW